MKKVGLSRPGGIQMLVCVLLMVLAVAGPGLIAATRPSREWLMVVNGLPALAMMIGLAAILLFYVVGFLVYCADKGYSKWLGFWLLLGNIPGFIALMLLPDLDEVREGKTGTKLLQSA